MPPTLPQANDWKIGPSQYLSGYHRHFGDEQGEETRPTLYLQRNLTKSYHIDYGYFGHGWTVNEVQVVNAAEWLAISDHMPIVFDVMPNLDSPDTQQRAYFL